MTDILRDNCKRWVGTFNTVKLSLIEKAFKNNIDNWIEHTTNCIEYDSWLPMWGYLWNPDNYTSNCILQNINIVSDIGFRVFEDTTTGDIYLGIDGAGYDFYEAHWIPLYNAIFNNRTK